MLSFSAHEFLFSDRCSLHFNISKFARLAQIICEPKTRGFGLYSRQVAKHAKFGRTNNSLQTNSLPLIRTLRLGVFAGDPPNSCFTFFARDIPRLTGARSAPYENLRVRSPVEPCLRGESDFSHFGCGCAALGPLWLNFFSDLVKAAPLGPSWPPGRLYFPGKIVSWPGGLIGAMAERQTCHN